jgi:RimJ/RimL family protein N-acetyltransferase
MLPGMYEGTLVRLRAHEPDDAADMHRWMNDPETRQFLMGRYPFAMAAEVAWASQGSPTYDNCSFAVESRADGRLVGGVDLRTRFGPENRVADLGIVIDKRAWGKGIGTDAMITACRFGFEEMDLARIELWVFATNERARHVYEKVGFVHEGTARQRLYKGGSRIDEHLYGLLRDEFRP